MTTAQLIVTFVAGLLVVAGGAGLVALAPRSTSDTRWFDLVSIASAVAGAAVLVVLVAIR